MRNTSFKISQFHDMQNRAPDQASCDSIRIQIHADIDCVPLHNCHVPIKNIVMTPVALVDAEWLERIRRDEVPNLFRRNHRSEKV